MTAGVNCLKLIHHFEGCKLIAYKCPADVWTIGYGSTRYADGLQVKEGDEITQQQTDVLLMDTLRTYEAAVNRDVKVPLLNHQFDALVSFCYNIGVGNFHNSSLLKIVNVHQFDTEIPELFMRWKYAKGEILMGLVRRRNAEAYLYMTGSLKFNFKP